MASSLSFAQTTPDAFKPNPTQWLTKDQEQALIATVPPPPAPGSPEDQADLAAILAAQQARTPDIETECKLDQGFSEHLFQSIYGSNLTQDNSPKFYHLMKTVLALTGLVNGAAKGEYKRPRPYQGHPDVVHALFQVGGYSYPSGHSMASFTLAVVLGAIFPDKQQAFLDRAGQIAQSRVNAGVHYPSDIKEGEVLGKATAAAILASPAFQADLAGVKAELKM
jgi:hypothetical protein